MRLILNGYNGFMCQEILKLAQKEKDIDIVAGVSRSGAKNHSTCEVYKKFADFNKQNRCSCFVADCIIDFSHHQTTHDMTSFAVEHKIPMVIATTGQSDAEAQRIQDASVHVPIFFTSNYSIGIALLVTHAKQIAKSFGKDADIEIVETHHNRKADAPSGTALTIAKEIQQVIPGREIHTGRCGLEPRKNNEIGISSVRMGNIVGIHEVHICNNNECITLKHEAFSRQLFANGAIEAARFLVGKKPGLYDMKSLVG